MISKIRPVILEKIKEGIAPKLNPFTVPRSTAVVKSWIAGQQMNATTLFMQRMELKGYFIGMDEKRAILIVSLFDRL
jgi:hypothetical protein